MITVTKFDENLSTNENNVFLYKGKKYILTLKWSQTSYIPIKYFHINVAAVCILKMTFECKLLKQIFLTFIIVKRFSLHLQDSETVIINTLYVVQKVTDIHN